MGKPLSLLPSEMRNGNEASLFPECHWGAYEEPELPPPPHSHEAASLSPTKVMSEEPAKHRI